MEIDKSKIKNFLRLTLFLFVLYILQAFVFPRVVLWNAKPLILPIAAIGVGYFGGGIRGGVFGLFCGLLCDASFDSTPLFTFLLPLLGLAAGMASQYYLIPGPLSYVLCSVGGLLVISIFQMFSFVVFKNTKIAAAAETALYQSLYSLIFALLLYWPERLLTRRR
jgi:hypothetical protein